MMGIAEWPAIFLGLHRIMTVNSSCLDAHRNHRRAEVRARTVFQHSLGQHVLGHSSLSE